MKGVSPNIKMKLFKRKFWCSKRERDKTADFKRVQNRRLVKNKNLRFCQCVRLAVNKIIIIT